MLARATISRHFVLKLLYASTSGALNPMAGHLSLAENLVHAHDGIQGAEVGVIAIP
jgi:hypothetical protein